MKAVAADVDSYPTLLDRVGDLLRTPYDWSAEVQRITAPTLLVFADADSISITHVAEFFGLLGGGRHDGNFDGTSPTPMRLAVLPGMTHYSIHAAPQLP
ncbi:MAG TPA: hypothetical protein VFX16_26830, partial [Pseudonocardiaceae bacterium]|nr:hypothetical protein [Pseudonocardiaceae bacterium]